MTTTTTTAVGTVRAAQPEDRSEQICDDALLLVSAHSAARPTAVISHSCSALSRWTPPGPSPRPIPGTPTEGASRRAYPRGEPAIDRRAHG
ncbi:hypothetical protein M8J71_16245 [Pseudarthrobacter sp. R1]|uniref:hypothetical protein n=1 Tax=Pseudarthrobacter sp. R1 TaxID=2944934 RepID=UPI00210BD2EE|nr:hypothetical protein [Pseudarthrobacter sp. R1]MCQ6272022.1 hypothetical protein [Pseudarthrobacter sp. R1]